MINIRPYIQKYYKDWIRISKLESYKWEAFKHYQENYHINYDSYLSCIKHIYKKTQNLLASSNYYPLERLKDFSSPKYGKPDRLQELFSSLLIMGDLPTPQRVSDFIKGTDSIMLSMMQEGYKLERKKTDQDVRAVSVYLSMFYPNDFYLYKYTVYKKTAELFGEKITSTDPIARLFEYQEFCKKVKKELKKETEFIRFYKEWLKDHKYEDKNLNLLTQDFIYAVAVHLDYSGYEKIKDNKSRTQKVTEFKISEIKSSIRPKEYAFKGTTDIDYEKNYRENKSIGNSGEIWALNYEKERLKKLNIDPSKATRVSESMGDGVGYDILSVNTDGSPRYIEVKTTRGDVSQPIFFTENELQFSIINETSYHLYRIYDFKAGNEPAKLVILSGSLDNLNYEATTYKAQIDL